MIEYLKGLDSISRNLLNNFPRVEKWNKMENRFLAFSSHLKQNTPLYLKKLIFQMKKSSKADTKSKGKTWK